MNDAPSTDPAPEQAGKEVLPAAEIADEEAEPVEPYEAQVDENVKQRILGSQYEKRQRFDKNEVTGPSMMGDQNTQNNTHNIFSPHLKATFRRPPNLELLASSYAPAEEREEKALREMLDLRTTICLTGEPETGKLTTACVALLERFAPDRIKLIMPPPDQTPVNALQQLATEDLKPGMGYLLEIDDSDPAPIIRRLDALMHAGQARLVLIRNQSGPTARYSEGDIQHRPPVPSEVFRAHVRRLGAGSNYANLADRVPLPAKPHEVAWLASEALRRTVPEAEQFLIEHSIGKLRAKAEAILGVEGGGGRSGRRRLPQHQRAFRIAYAAMAGRPIGHVFDATGHLLAKLDEESGWADIGRTALEHSVPALLGADLAPGWQSAINPDRLARVEDDLARTIFDVAWHEFDHTRPALLAWLNSMVADADADKREGAVRVAVELALLDFDGIWREIIDGWSRSDKTRVRLSAAQVVLILGSAKRVSHLVARRVHRWVQGESNRQRGTAAWAYAGGLLLSDPHWVLADLRRIAVDPIQRRDWTVATAVTHLFENGLPGRVIVAALADWIRTDAPELLVTCHSARSFTRVLDLAPGKPSGVEPALLRDLADGVLKMHDLAALWRAALLGASTRREAWNGLLIWLRHADSDRYLRGPVGDLMRELATFPALRRRMVRCLRRPDTPDWIIADIEEWTR